MPPLPKFCSYCRQQCDSHYEDNGVGVTEYWGSLSVHHQWDEVSDCCGEEVVSEGELLEMKTSELIRVVDELGRLKKQIEELQAEETRLKELLKASDMESLSGTQFTYTRRVAVHTKVDCEGIVSKLPKTASNKALIASHMVVDYASVVKNLKTTPAVEKLIQEHTKKEERVSVIVKEVGDSE